jgi:hypothetical protein
MRPSEQIKEEIAARTERLWKPPCGPKGWREYPVLRRLDLFSTCHREESCIGLRKTAIERQCTHFAEMNVIMTLLHRCDGLRLERPPSIFTVDEGRP